MAIGNRIYELRKSQKLSQEKLAEKIGVTRQTISNWELNESSPDLKQAKELITDGKNLTFFSIFKRN